MKKKFLIFFALFFLLVGIMAVDAQPRNVDSLKKIEKLYLANLDLKKLPEWIFSCENIREIDLSGNKKIDLYRAFEELSNFANLEDVIIQNVNCSLPYNFYKIKKLKYLDLRGNKLKRLPYSLKYCEYLTGINLDNNEIDLKTLAFLCKSLPNLEWLSVGRNHLSMLPIEICMPKLKILSLYGNNIVSLPGCLYQSITLMSLQFSGHIVDGETIENPIHLNIQEIRDNFKKNGRQVDVN